MNEEIAPDALIPYLREQYALEDPITCSLIRRGFNDSYLVEAAADKFVFRVYFRDKYYIAGPDDFRWEHDLLAHLHENGVPVCPPIPTRAGYTLGSITDAYGERSCALFSFAPGEPPAKTDLARAGNLGEITARTHLAADRFTTTYHRYHFDLRYLIAQPLQLMDDFLKNQRRAGVGGYRAAIALQESLISVLGQELPAYGPIHGDLHRGNVLADGNGMTLIDFDHGGYGWRAYDIASCTGGMPEEAWSAFIESYEKLRPLEPSEHSAIEAFRLVRPIWDMGDVLAMREAWSNHSDFGPEFADRIEEMLKRQFGKLG
ncbi:MAG TPA: phosphotransferase [Capsulimonadaceae bacterium]|nr:phosphotransferase [Capsulimonadaceae bacterium]